MLEIRIYLPDEYVCYEGQISEEMYFIESGVLEVLDGIKGVKIRLSEGDFFGEQVKKISNPSLPPTSLPPTLLRFFLIPFLFIPFLFFPSFLSPPFTSFSSKSLFKKYYFLFL